MYKTVNWKTGPARARYNLKLKKKKIKYPKEFLEAIKQLKKEGTIKETKKNTYRLEKIKKSRKLQASSFKLQA